MALFEESSLRQLGIKSKEFRYTDSTTILKKAYETTPSAEKFSIFLCHSFLDADVVLGLKTRIESLGYSVYIDWFEDPSYTRSEVTKEIAIILKKRMANCSSLFFATSANSTHSKWMPWECGYFDGLCGAVAICPISRSVQYTYTGQEYLGIYPYVQQDNIKDTERDALWICESNSKYILFDSWLKGNQPVEH